jgi:pyroglutamyl-peptidase
MTLLITGFGPFEGGSNASEALVRAIADNEPPGAGVETLVLPVDTARAPSLLDEALERLEPSRLLMTGQAAGRGRISLEQVARNRRMFRVPDCAGRLLQGEPVADGGPDAYRSCWPDLPGLADALNRAGIPAALSEDCGGHLCNQLLYHVLHTSRRLDRTLPAVFLHLPLLPEQVRAGEPAALRHPDCPSMPLAMTVRAVHLIAGIRNAQEAAA